MIESIITAKSQTTLPSGVRKALDVGPGDRLAYIVEGERAVIMKANADGEDPVIGAFLEFLARDMIGAPETLTALTPELIARAGMLVDGIQSDPDAPIEGDVQI
jgi:antitoxin PrlF